MQATAANAAGVTSSMQSGAVVNTALFYALEAIITTVRIMQNQLAMQFPSTPLHPPGIWWPSGSGVKTFESAKLFEPQWTAPVTDSQWMSVTAATDGSHTQQPSRQAGRFPKNKSAHASGYESGSIGCRCCGGVVKSTSMRCSKCKRKWFPTAEKPVEAKSWRSSTTPKESGAAISGNSIGNRSQVRPDRSSGQKPGLADSPLFFAMTSDSDESYRYQDASESAEEIFCDTPPGRDSTSDFNIIKRAAASPFGLAVNPQRLVGQASSPQSEAEDTCKTPLGRDSTTTVEFLDTPPRRGNGFTDLHWSEASSQANQNQVEVDAHVSKSTAKTPWADLIDSSSNSSSSTQSSVSGSASTFKSEAVSDTHPPWISQLPTLSEEPMQSLPKTHELHLGEEYTVLANYSFFSEGMKVRFTSRVARKSDEPMAYVMCLESGPVFERCGDIPCRLLVPGAKLAEINAAASHAVVNFMHWVDREFGDARLLDPNDSTVVSSFAESGDHIGAIESDVAMGSAQSKASDVSMSCISGSAIDLNDAIEGGTDMAWSADSASPPSVNMRSAPSRKTGYRGKKQKGGAQPRKP